MTIYNAQLNIIKVKNEDIFDKVECIESLIIYGHDSLLDLLYEMKLRITETINLLQEELK